MSSDEETMKALEAIRKTLEGIKTRAEEQPRRNANVLVDALKMESCPKGLVGCNAHLLHEATAGLLTCPPIEEASDPLIVDFTGKVCYAPDSLRNAFKGKKIDIDSIIKTASEELFKGYANAGVLERMILDSKKFDPGAKVVTNILFSNEVIAGIIAGLVGDSSEGLVYMSTFTDRVSAETGKMISDVVQGGTANAGLIMLLLTISIVYGREKSSGVLRDMNILGTMWNHVSAAEKGETRFMYRNFPTENIWEFSLQMVLYNHYSKSNNGYFVAIAAAQNAYYVLQTGNDEINNGKYESWTKDRRHKYIDQLTQSYVFKANELAHAIESAQSDKSQEQFNSAMESIRKTDTILRKTVPVLEGTQGSVTEEKKFDDFIQAGKELEQEELTEKAVRSRRGSTDSSVSTYHEKVSGGEKSKYSAFLQGGARDPEHANPDSVLLSVGHSPLETAAKKALRNRLTKLGYPVTVFETDKCPAFVNAEGNSYGASTREQWVETVHPWAKCEELMGARYKTPNGFCYPPGMGCYDVADIRQKTVRKVTEQTVDKGYIYAQVASAVNKLRQQKFEAWKAEKQREIEASNTEYSADEKAEILAEMIKKGPEEYRHMPDAVSVLTTLTTSRELNYAVNELQPDQTAVEERKKLAKILLESGTYDSRWKDDDKTKQTENLSELAGELVEAADECTKTSIEQNQLPPGTEREEVEGCVELDVDGEKSLIPDAVNRVFDQEAVLDRGAKVDPLVLWWRQYDAQKKRKHAERMHKLKAALAAPIRAERSAQRPTVRELVAKAVPSQFVPR